MKENCQNCHFFKTSANFHPDGWCLRFPPTPTITPQHERPQPAQFPLVNKRGWCGEWRVILNEEFENDRHT